MIYSIGYQAITVDELLSIMAAKGIDRMVDIRSSPYSRWEKKYEFNRNRMSARLGDRYVWKGDMLGGKPGPASDEGLDWLVSQTDNVVIVCMEAAPRKCHRFQDVGKRLLARGIEVHHIIDNGRTVVTTSRLIQVEAEEAASELF